MEKVTAILEKYVQWIVLGLAALFLGYMAYTYVMSEPTKITVGSQSVVPSEIDKVTATGPVLKLNNDLAKEAPNMSVADFVKEWTDKITGGSPQFSKIHKSLEHYVWANVGKISE